MKYIPWLMVLLLAGAFWWSMTRDFDPVVIDRQATIDSLIFENKELRKIIEAIDHRAQVLENERNVLRANIKKNIEYHEKIIFIPYSDSARVAAFKELYPSFR